MCTNYFKEKIMTINSSFENFFDYFPLTPFGKELAAVHLALWVFPSEMFMVTQ